MEMLHVHPIVAVAIPLLALVIGALCGASARSGSEADAWTHGYQCGQRAALEKHQRQLETLPEPRLVGEE